jgi:hypothetical protein
MKIFLIFFAFAFFSFSRISAQEAPKVKFGKVADEELRMTVYGPDTTAAAVILFDDGQSRVRYDVGQKRFMLTFERFLRIKVLKQSGTDWGNFYISLYSSGMSREELGAVDGVTFNLEGEKIQKSDLKKEAIFKERENKYWEAAKISLPSVKVGSVIDLKYTINSPFVWNLRTWKFQYTIPVKWSQYDVLYPEYFMYNHSSLGYHTLNSQNQTTQNESINYTATYVTSGSALSGGGNREKVNETITYLANKYNYTAKEVPAMKVEPYLTTLENYTTRMKFELASTNFTRIGGEYKNYTNTWSIIGNDLLADEDFGGQLKGGNFVEEDVKNLISGKTTQMRKAVAVYSHIQSTIKWDNIKSVMPSKPIRKTYSDKSGNSADLNMLLAAMLHKAGIEADPVILSTRDHGLISPVHASLSDCNYMIVKAMIDDKPVLMDVTDPLIPAGQLPFRCLNGNGVLLKKDAPEDVAITNPASTSNTSVILEMKDGKFSGEIMSRVYGLNAYNFRQEVKKAGGPQAQFESLKNSSDGIQYTNYSYNYLDSLYFPVEKKYQIVLDAGTEDEASILYINPILWGKQQKNPFTSPTRQYPVDFGAPFSEIYRLNLTIPEGYKVEELPKGANIKLGENDGKFSYAIGQMDNRVVVNMRFSIDKTLFLPAEYANLKDFFDMVVAKEAEQIVLKKISAQ